MSFTVSSPILCGHMVASAATGFRHLCAYYVSLHLQSGATPLFMASQNGHSSVVDVLLRHGADPHLANRVSILYI